MSDNRKSDADITQAEFSTPVTHVETAARHHDGTVHLTNSRGTILIPSPSKDPRDPLNLPLWQKLIIVGITSMYSTMGLTAVSGLGGLLVFFIPQYSAEGGSYGDISALLTYPSLFMGIGNFISMPLALALGRRPVFIASCALQIIACILCAANQGYTWHFAARNILGIAAGQSEALCPLIVSEIFFIHERASYQQYFNSAQTIISGVLMLSTSYIGASIGWRNWYYLFAGFTGAIFIFAVVFLVETKFDRPLAAYKGEANNNSTPGSGSATVNDPEDPKSDAYVLTVGDERIIDNVNFAPRTLLSGMRLFVNSPDWKEGLLCCKHMGQMFFFPAVLWAYTMTGVILAGNIAMGLTYGTALTKSYGWLDKYVSLLQAGQIVIAFICIPLLGYGSDWAIKFMARRNKGIHEPEFRLLPLMFPILVGIMFVTIYGQALAHPEKFHWAAIIITLNGYFFSFVGSSVVSITYLLDAYPTRGAAALVLLCAMRGVISFCISYSFTGMYAAYGYDGAFGIFAGLTGVFGVLAIGIYFSGKHLRRLLSQWTEVENPWKPTMG